MGFFPLRFFLMGFFPTWENMGKHRKVGKYGKILGSIGKWENMGRYGKIWGSIGKGENIGKWDNMAR